MRALTLEHVCTAILAPLDVAGVRMVSTISVTQLRAVTSLTRSTLGPSWIKRYRV